MMTTEEFLQRLSIRPVTFGDLHGKTVEDDLRALVRCEIELCAAIADADRAATGDKPTAAGRIAEKIRRTSPGTSGQECPDCEGCGRHGDPTSDKWYSDSSEECGRCGGTGKILRTSPAKEGG